jgi:hypothetical protein
MSKPSRPHSHAASDLYGGNLHRQSLASDWTFCEYYVPAAPVVAAAPRRNIWGRIVSR